LIPWLWQQVEHSAFQAVRLFLPYILFMRLAILNTHPVQYFAPVFRELAARSGVELQVFYGWKGAVESTLDRGFGQAFAWDVPLLEGYSFEFLENVAADPGTHHTGGIDCPQVVDLIQAWKPDALLVYGWNYRSHQQALRGLHGSLPIFFRGDSTLLDERPGWRQWARRLYLRWIYRNIDWALAVGTANRAYFKAHGLPESRICHVPHSVDHSFFADPDGQHIQAARQWRETLGIPADAPVVLFAGKLESKKAPDLLLKAFQALGHPTAHLVFGGTGPLEAELKQDAPARVHFAGFQNQSRMPVLYRLGDLLVLPSRGPGETWGLALNEAMACGRAVIASDKTGAALDLIQPGRNGFVFPSGNLSALSAVLHESLVDAARLQEMGRQSLQIIRDWSISQQVDAMLAALREALRGA
jgi:glycosyltransferase involved in cell wall biosynthesis